MKILLLTIIPITLLFACNESSDNQFYDVNTDVATFNSHFIYKKDKEIIKSILIGSDIPMKTHKMLDISGKKMSLEQINKKEGLLVIFSCNSCPFVVGNGEKSDGWEGRYNGLKKLADKKNVGMVLINSNEAKRKGDDSFEKMKEHAKEAGYNNLYYLVDNNHKLADAFGASTTPHVYLFNKQGKLAYMGAIDDNVAKASEVNKTYLKNAIKNMVAGEKINPKTTRNIGCSIKRHKR